MNLKKVNLLLFLKKLVPKNYLFKVLLIGLLAIKSVIGFLIFDKHFNSIYTNGYFMVWTFEIGCSIYSFEGEKVGTFPGTYCRFLKNGNILFSTSDVKIIRDSFYDPLWKSEGFASHEVNFDEPSGEVWYIHLDKSEQYKTIDTIIGVDKNQNRIFTWNTFENREKLFQLSNRLKRLREKTGYFLTNGLQVIPENKLYDKLPAFRPGNILVSEHTHGLAYVIDRETKDIVWSYQTLCGGIHTARFYSDGELYMFINDDCKSRMFPNEGSTVIQLDPLTKKRLWEFSIENDPDLKCAYYGSIEKIPTGKLMISYGCAGSAVVITDKTKQIYWKKKVSDFNKSKHFQIYRALYVSKHLVDRWLSTLKVF